MESWEAALNAFLDEWKDKDYVIGAMVCGSFITGRPTEHSDVDLHIILSDKVDWRERGNRIIDGFLIEYFANPARQFKSYFEEDHSDNNRSAATQFATGRILFDKDGTVGRLKEEACRWIEKPFAKPDETAVELSKYGLWDNLDNIQDAYKQQASDFAYIYHHTLRRVYETYAKYLGQPVISFSKQYRCLHCPEEARKKYLMNPFPDEDFSGMLSQAVTETDKDRMLKYAEDITWYVLRKMGGFEIDGWKFRSPAG